MHARSNDIVQMIFRLMQPEGGITACLCKNYPPPQHVEFQQVTRRVQPSRALSEPALQGRGELSYYLFSINISKT